VHLAEICRKKCDREQFLGGGGGGASIQGKKARRKERALADDTYFLRARTCNCKRKAWRKGAVVDQDRLGKTLLGEKKKRRNKLGEGGFEWIGGGRNRVGCRPPARGERRGMPRNVSSGTMRGNQEVQPARRRDLNESQRERQKVSLPFHLGERGRHVLPATRRRGGGGTPPETQR